MATLPYQPAPRRASGKGPLALGAVTIPATILWALFYPGLVSILPRAMQGEPVTVPFIACVAPYLMFPVLLPTVFVRRGSSRIVCVLCLSAFSLIWYFGLGFDELLSKAWRRGL